MRMLSKGNFSWSIVLALLPGAAWGMPLILSFPKSGGDWWVESPLEALHLSDPQGPPPYLAVMEVPPTAPPGVYRVCLGEVCQEVKVEPRRSLEVHLPPSAIGELPVRLKNGGNLREDATLRPAEASQVQFPTVRVSLAPGEEKALSLPLKGAGLLLLEVRSQGGRRFYPVRVVSEDPFSPSLRGRVFGGTDGLGLEALLLGPDGGRALSLLLERAWAGGATLGLRLSAPGLSLSLSSREPYLQAAFAQGGAEGGLSLGAGGLEGRFSLSTSPFRLWTGVQLLPEFRLRALGLGYLEGSVGLSLAWPPLFEGRLGFPQGEVLVRVEEVGASLRLSLPPVHLEGGLRGSVPLFYAGYEGTVASPTGEHLEGGLAYRLGAGYGGFPYLEGSVGYGGVSLEGRLAQGGASLQGRLEIREGDWSFRGRAALGGEGLALHLEVQGDLDPLRLRLEGEWREGGGSLQLLASYSFSLGLPAEAGFLLGYPPPALLEGETLPQGRILAGGVERVADERGHFTLRLPPGAYRVQALPPPGVLGLPVEERIDLRPGERASLRLFPRRAVSVQVVCKEGSGQIRLRQVSPSGGTGEGAGIDLPCGGKGLLPEGQYQVEGLPAKGYRLASPLFPLLLEYGEEAVVQVPFEPIPVERVSPKRLIPIQILSLEGLPTQVAAPGETLRVVAPGAEGLFLEGQGVRLPLPLGQVTLPQDLPPGVYTLEAVGPGERGVVELTLDPARPLFLATFSPPRPTPEERVEVVIQPRTLVREVVLYLPWGETLPLSEEGGRFRGEFVLPAFLEGGKVVLLEGVGLRPGGRVLPFRVAFRLR